MIITSFTKMVKRMVGHGRAAVSSRSRSNSGVVMNLVTKSTGIHHHHHRRQGERERERQGGNILPIDVSNIEDLAVKTRHL